MAICGERWFLSGLSGATSCPENPFVYRYLSRTVSLVPPTPAAGLHARRRIDNSWLGRFNRALGNVVQNSLIWIGEFVRGVEGG